MTNVIVAKSFYDAVARLPLRDKGRFFDLQCKFQRSPANPGVSLERVRRTRSNDIWSARASQELRAILHKDASVWVFLYGGHHDEVYKWAESHQAGRNPATGQLQIVEVAAPRPPVPAGSPGPTGPAPPPMFSKYGDEYLLSLGVPESWMPTVREIRSENDVNEVCNGLPEEAGLALLELADGGLVTPPKPLPKTRPITEAPGIQSRFFFVSEDVQGLRAALQAPLERWIAFLHPDQRSMVEREFNGPAKVSGSAGTGKTVVAMHRARILARQGERVLLTTFTKTLALNLQRGLNMLCSKAELGRVDVRNVDSAAMRTARTGSAGVHPDESKVGKLLGEARERFAPLVADPFVRAEWSQVISMQGITTWEEYRDARRIGRGVRMPAAERRQLWPVFEATLDAMKEAGVCTWNGLSAVASRLLREGAVSSPYSAVVVDEVQDLTVAKLRFLYALCASKPENFILCGDAGQRIYPGGFSLRALGIEVRGRSTILRVNYRTSKQIQTWADKVRKTAVDDMEGGSEPRVETRSVFRGPEPRLLAARSWDEEARNALGAIREWRQAGYGANEIAVFAPFAARLRPLQQALDEAGIAWDNLAKDRLKRREAVLMGTMHRAKGLEFKVVLVLGCDARSLPSAQARKVEDPVERQNALDLQRNLLYAAMTRARDELVVSWAGQPSPFLGEVP